MLQILKLKSGSNLIPFPSQTFTVLNPQSPSYADYAFSKLHLPNFSGAQ